MIIIENYNIVLLSDDSFVKRAKLQLPSLIQLSARKTNI